MFSKQQLETLYKTQNLSLAKIAKQAGVSVPTIANWMDKYSIPRRSISQALTGRKLSKAHATKVKKNIEKANLERHLNGVSDEEKERLKQIKPDRKGVKHSEVTKAKMRAAHFGKKLSKETRKKMSEARKGIIKGSKHPLYGAERPDMQGENNPNWNGGISSLYKRIRKMTKYTEWRTSCFQRDNYTCQKCNKRGSGDLQVDHIKPFALIVHANKIKSTYEAQSCKALWDTKNGRTLCEECHKSTKTYGQSVVKQQQQQSK